MHHARHISTHEYSLHTHTLSAGMPVSNDDADSTKSGSSRSDNHSQPTFHHPYPIMLVGKGKQLPKGIYLSTAELVELAGTNDPVHLKHLDQSILELKEVIQMSKQEFVKMKEKWGSSESLEVFRPSDVSGAVCVGLLEYHVNGVMYNTLYMYIHVC